MLPLEIFDKLKADEQQGLLKIQRFITTASVLVPVDERFRERYPVDYDVHADWELIYRIRDVQYNCRTLEDFISKTNELLTTRDLLYTGGEMRGEAIVFRVLQNHRGRVTDFKYDSATIEFNLRENRARKLARVLKK